MIHDLPGALAALLLFSDLGGHVRRARRRLLAALSRRRSSRSPRGSRRGLRVLPPRSRSSRACGRSSTTSTASTRSAGTARASKRGSRSSSRPRWPRCCSSGLATFYAGLLRTRALVLLLFFAARRPLRVRGAHGDPAVSRGSLAARRTACGTSSSSARAAWGAPSWTSSSSTRRRGCGRSASWTTHPEKRARQYRGVPVLGTTAEVARIVEEKRASTPCFSRCLSTPTARCWRSSRTSRRTVADVRVVPDLLQHITFRAGVEDLDGLPGGAPDPGPAYRLDEPREAHARHLDRRGVARRCSLRSSPRSRVAIRLSDGGPVLYRQRRMGLDGRPFEIVKFRSMRRGRRGRVGTHVGRPGRSAPDPGRPVPAALEPRRAAAASQRLQGRDVARRAAARSGPSSCGSSRRSSRSTCSATACGPE